MAHKKNHEVDGWIHRPDTRCQFVLVYGPDRGLVSERARAFVQASGFDTKDPFSVVVLSADDLENHPHQLAIETGTISMFSERRLIWIRNLIGQKSVISGLRDLLANPPQDAIVLVEAGDLRKGTALRSESERGRSAMALPCYSDDLRAIDRLIDEEVKSARLSIDTNARNELIQLLGGDRLATRGELEKLVLFCLGREKITSQDIADCIGDASSVTIDAAIDALLSGNVPAFDTNFSRNMQAGVQAFLLLSAALRQFQRLETMRHAMDDQGKSASIVVGNARPPIFFKRRAVVESALRCWDQKSIFKAGEFLNATILSTRLAPEIATARTHHALMALTIQSARRMAGMHIS